MKAFRVKNTEENLNWSEEQKKQGNVVNYSVSNSGKMIDVKVSDNIFLLCQTTKSLKKALGF